MSRKNFKWFMLVTAVYIKDPSVYQKEAWVLLSRCPAETWNRGGWRFRVRYDTKFM